MALATAYAQSSTPRTYVDHLIIAHFDSHGVATAAALAKKMMDEGKRVRVISRFPDTGPQGFNPELVQKILTEYSASTVHVVDIPINVRNPEASIEALRHLASHARTLYWDHHETDKPHLQRLIDAGVTPILADTALSMAILMGLIGGKKEIQDLAIIGIVADRDRSILRILSKEDVERKYLPLANRLDVLVRQPQLANVQDQGSLAMLLAVEGISLLNSIDIRYPPEEYVRELVGKIVEEGQVALVVDWTDQQFQQSAWTPKTMEQLALMHNKPIVIAVVPGFNPRTRTQEGWDVRVIKYWLAPADIPSPEEVARDVIQQAAVKGNVVGHCDYVSIRFESIDVARRVADLVFKRYEGMLPSTAHLIEDKVVAQAVRRDFQTILEKLEQILEQQTRMYQEYLDLKRRQVELLEKTQRHEYD